MSNKNLEERGFEEADLKNLSFEEKRLLVRESKYTADWNEFYRKTMAPICDAADRHHKAQINSYQKGISHPVY